MREVLSVRPVQRLQRTAARFEGPLLKRSRFLGWRPLWVNILWQWLLKYQDLQSQYWAKPFSLLARSVGATVTTYSLVDHRSVSHTSSIKKKTFYFIYEWKINRYKIQQSFHKLPKTQLRKIIHPSSIIM